HRGHHQILAPLGDPAGDRRRAPDDRDRHGDRGRPPRTARRVTAVSRLRVRVEGREFELDGREVHYLLSDGRHLRLTTTPSDGGTPRQVGYFVTVLGRWFFHADNIPAARVLRIDGQPVTNVRQELRTGRTTVSLVPDVYTGPRSRRPVPAGGS